MGVEGVVGNAKSQRRSSKVVVVERSDIFVRVDGTLRNWTKPQKFQLNALDSDHDMSLRKAKVTLAGAVAFSALTIWAVHFQQNQEAEVWILPTSCQLL